MSTSGSRSDTKRPSSAPRMYFSIRSCRKIGSDPREPGARLIQARCPEPRVRTNKTTAASAVMTAESTNSVLNPDGRHRKAFRCEESKVNAPGGALKEAIS